MKSLYSFSTYKVYIYSSSQFFTSIYFPQTLMYASLDSIYLYSKWDTVTHIFYLQIRQCSECAESLYCRDTNIRCVTSPCPQAYECVDPCGGCQAGTVCKPTGSKTGITYACLSRESCGGCPAGQVCREDHTLCNGEPCAQQRCVNPINDQCGVCPAGLKCQYISTGCPKAQCSPPKYRCISAGAVEGQCSPVSSGFSLDYILCKVLSVSGSAKPTKNAGMIMRNAALTIVERRSAEGSTG